MKLFQKFRNMAPIEKSFLINDILFNITIICFLLFTISGVIDHLRNNDLSAIYNAIWAFIMVLMLKILRESEWREQDRLNSSKGY